MRFASSSGFGSRVWPERQSFRPKTFKLKTSTLVVRRQPASQSVSHQSINQLRRRRRKGLHRSAQQPPPRLLPAGPAIIRLFPSEPAATPVTCCPGRQKEVGSCKQNNLSSARSEPLPSADQNARKERATRESREQTLSPAWQQFPVARPRQINRPGQVPGRRRVFVLGARLTPAAAAHRTVRPADYVIKCGPISKLARGQV